MPLKFTESLGMYFRNSPVSKIKEALKKCEAAGVAITAKDLEAHHLCGKDPMTFADALILAKKLGVTTSLQEMSAICLAGRDPIKILSGATEERIARFDTFSPEREDKIIGFTREHQQVAATITITYRLSLIQLVFGFNLRHVHERLGAAVSVFINTSPSARALQLAKVSNEAELKVIALEMLKGLTSLSIEYR